MLLNGARKTAAKRAPPGLAGAGGRNWRRRPRPRRSRHCAGIAPGGLAAASGQNRRPARSRIPAAQRRQAALTCRTAAPLGRPERIGRTASARRAVCSRSRGRCSGLGRRSGARRSRQRSGGDDGPIQIQADSGIEWQQNQQVYIARGNAVAARGNNEVRADTLIAHYREKAGAKRDAKPMPRPRRIPGWRAG